MNLNKPPYICQGLWEKMDLAERIEYSSEYLMESKQIKLKKHPSEIYIGFDMYNPEIILSVSQGEMNGYKRYISEDKVNEFIKEKLSKLLEDMNEK